MLPIVFLTTLVICGYSIDTKGDFDLNLSDNILFEQFKEKFNKYYSNSEEENMRNLSTNTHIKPLSISFLK